jgi:multicomponent Na+:H+ antiporter subunit D
VASRKRVWGSFWAAAVVHSPGSGHRGHPARLRARAPADAVPDAWRVMDPTTSFLPLIAVGVPAATGVSIVLARRVVALRDSLLVIGAVVTFVCIAAMLPAVRDGQVPTTTLGELVPGVELTLAADGFGMIFALLAGLLFVLAAAYAIGYMRGDRAAHQTRFYAFYALCLSTAFAVAFAGDLITFFIAYELLTITTYPLVTHKGDAKAIAAGRPYIA